MLTVSYFSAGVSSAVATKLAINQIDRIMYTHIDDQHPDSMRFVKDCEAWFGKPVEIWQSPLKSVDAACRYAQFIASPQRAACTKRLKRQVRKKFEHENVGPMRIVWGLDRNEKDRAQRLIDGMPEFEHLFPLIDKNYRKATAHNVLKASGISRPAMYELGYHNNNCIGCVKGGAGYWNHIRVDFPEVFASRSKLERDIGHSIVKGSYLDELDPKAGRHGPPIVGDCGLFCEQMAI